jgi:retron-type reverse transcriptase
VDNQFGFRKGIATEDTIYKLTNETLNASSNKRVADSIFCDLEKAFDSVNHDLLIYKLKYNGIRDKAKLLLESYLQNRCQIVHIIITYLNSNPVSKWTKIKRGVPQGSILSLLLFMVYINNLPKAIKYKALPILFADDTNILLTSPNSIQLQIALNTVFEQLNNWFKSIFFIWKNLLYTIH